MRFRLDFHPLVPIDLAEASAWYERKEPRIGLRLEAEAKDLFRRLNDEALLYAIRFSDVRRVNLRKEAFQFGIQAKAERMMRSSSSRVISPCHKASLSCR